MLVPHEHTHGASMEVDCSADPPRRSGRAKRSRSTSSSPGAAERPRKRHLAAPRGHMQRARCCDDWVSRTQGLSIDREGELEGGERGDVAPDVDVDECERMTVDDEEPYAYTVAPCPPPNTPMQLADYPVQPYLAAPLPISIRTPIPATAMSIPPAFSHTHTHTHTHTLSYSHSHQQYPTPPLSPLPSFSSPSVYPPPQSSPQGLFTAQNAIESATASALSIDPTTNASPSSTLASPAIPVRKQRFTMGPRADCEKCRLGVPGHWAHLDRSHIH